MRRSWKRLCHRVVPIFIIAGLPSPVDAQQGALEINRTCATQTGCFAGDVAGYPVTISAPGSYRLTSNLSRSIQIGGTLNQSFIQILTGSVSLDLAGFHISCFTGLGTCNGTGQGIYSLYSGNSVANGSIEGVGAEAMLLGPDSQVSNVRALRNGNGIRVGEGSTVSGNVASGNDGYGIQTGNGGVISGNAVLANGTFGIQTGTGSTVIGNTVQQSGDDGIKAVTGAVVKNNASVDNGGDGISIGGTGTAQGNTVTSNGGYGLRLNSGVSYRANSISANNSGAILNGTNRGDNYCAGNGVLSEFCP